MHTKILLVVLLLVFSSVLIPNIVSAKQNSHSSIENKVKKYDKEKNCAPPTNLAERPNRVQYLTYFNCGHVSVLKNGTILRQFSLIVNENHKLPITLGDGQKNPPILFPAWTFNDTIPGPTMRMTEGEHVSITVINHGTMPHSLHMHSIHQGSVDGLPFYSGNSGLIEPGKSFTYNFVAAPFGVYPYHCHVMPVVEHIGRGLYGAMIIDPQKPRPAAKEMMFFLNGYDLKFNDPYPRLPTAAEASNDGQCF